MRNLEREIEAIRSMLAARDAGASAKVIEGDAVPALPPVQSPSRGASTSGH